MPYPFKKILIVTGVALGLTLSVISWFSWSAGQGDPALTNDQRAYARVTGIIWTSAGMCTAAGFSDGPGRVTVAEVLALVDQGPTAAITLLGEPDARLTDKTQTVALWWNAVIPDKPDDTQPPAFHLRLDMPSGIERIERVSCLGAKLAVTATAPR
jgi:hypothetical protein